MARALPRRASPDLARRRRQLNRFFPGVPLASRIEALPDLGLVYVRNPKVGTSTMLAWLDLLHTGHERDRVRGDLSWPAPDQVGWDRVMRMLDGEAFRFSFVRDPVTRFESAWRSKILSPGRVRARLDARLGRDPDAAEPLGFEEFLAAVEQQDPLAMDIHWRPQHLTLMHPVQDYDHLGRMETFDADIQLIRQRLGLPHAPAQARNVSPTDRPSAYEGRPDLVERVRALYARDLELYGY